MNEKTRFAAIALIVFNAVFSGHAQSLDIHSFDSSGQLKWTNMMDQGFYQIECRPSLAEGTWQTNGMPRISTNEPVISVSVPMNKTNCFYRVTWTNSAQLLYAISGVVYYLSEPVAARTLLLMQGSESIGSTNSSVSGTYSFDGLPNGMYWLQCPGDSQYNAAASGGVLSNGNLTVNVYLTKPMDLIAPTNNAVMNTNLPTFVWSEFPGSDHYHLWVLDSSTHEQLLSTNVTAISFLSTTPFNEGRTYRWFVAAMDATTNELAESPGSFLFTVKTNSVPPPADTYSLSGFVYYTNAVPNLPVDLRSQGFALLNSTISDMSGAYVFTGLTNGTYLVGTPGNSQYYGNAYYTVNINNGDEQQDVTCSMLLSLFSPADNALVRPEPPVFSWQSFPGTDHYTFDLYDNTFTRLDTANLGSTNYETVASLSNGARYYWQVSARDGMGVTLAQSSYRSFTFSSDTATYSFSGTIYNGTNVLSGQTVQLLPQDCTINPTILATVTSSATGFYAFTNLASGGYCVKWLGDATYNMDGPWWYNVNANVTVNEYLWRNTVLLSPTPNAVVHANLPTFTWQPVPTADYYTFMLFDSATNTQLERTNVVGTSYQTSVSLANGSTNNWRVMSYHSADTFHAVSRTPFPPPSFTVQIP